ncbi:hypothetical protein ACROYT_G015082 [Oculina patagonica]
MVTTTIATLVQKTDKENGESKKEKKKLGLSGSNLSITSLSIESKLKCKLDQKQSKKRLNCYQNTIRNSDVCDDKDTSPTFGDEDDVTVIGADILAKSIVFRATADVTAGDLKSRIEQDLAANAVIVVQELQSGKYLVELATKEQVEQLVSDGFEIKELHIQTSPPTGTFTNVSIMGLWAYINDDEVIQELKSLLRKEMHWTDDIRFNIERDWGGEIVMSCGDNYARGVAILFCPNLDFILLDRNTDSDGCLATVTTTIDKITLRITALYAPNTDTEQTKFFATI